MQFADADPFWTSHEDEEEKCEALVDARQGLQMQVRFTS